VSSDYIECPEVVGKTVKSLKLYTAESGETEILIEFEDGTSFLNYQETKTSHKASLIETGVGESTVIKNYAE
jgi:hypothetical protein